MDNKILNMKMINFWLESRDMAIFGRAKSAPPPYLCVIQKTQCGIGLSGYGHSVFSYSLVCHYPNYLLYLAREN